MNPRTHRAVLTLGIILLLVSCAIPIVAQDATFDLKKDVPAATKLLAQAGWRKVWEGDDFIEYGNWYGPGILGAAGETKTARATSLRLTSWMPSPNAMTSPIRSPRRWARSTARRKRSG